MTEERYTSRHTGQEIDDAVDAVATKADVDVIGGAMHLKQSQAPLVGLYNIEPIASCDSDNKMWFCEDGHLYYRRNGAISSDGKDYDLGVPAYTIYYSGNSLYGWDGSAFFAMSNSGGNSGLIVGDNGNADLEFADDVGNVIMRLKDGHIATKYFDSARLPIEEDVEVSLKIFFVGNSFSMDAAAYAPFIVKAADQNIKLTIGCAYIGGCSLQTHLSNLQNDSASYAYYKSVNGGAWSSASSQKMSTMLADETWDVVVMQQNSDNAGDYDTICGTNDYLGGCITQIVTRLGRTPKFWWLLTQRKTSVVYTYDTMLSIAHRVMLEYPIDMMIPVGASVELARGTTLDSIGSNVHLEADANGHLQEGLPVMLAGYSLALTIFRALNIGLGVIGNTYTFSTTPTPSAQQNGSVVGMTSTNLRIAQHCAEVADKENHYNFK